MRKSIGTDIVKELKYNLKSLNSDYKRLESKYHNLVNEYETLFNDYKLRIIAFEKLSSDLDSFISEFEQYKNESIKWSVEDFTSLEKEGWTITPAQAKDALESMIEGHDCTLGITWETVDCYYEEYGNKIDPNE